MLRLKIIWYNSQPVGNLPPWLSLLIKVILLTPPRCPPRPAIHIPCQNTGRMWREKTVGLVSSKNAWNLTISCSQSATRPALWAVSEVNTEWRDLSRVLVWSLSSNWHTASKYYPHPPSGPAMHRENSPLWLLVHFGNLSISIKNWRVPAPDCVEENVKWQILLREKQLRYNFLWRRKNSITRYHPP